MSQESKDYENVLNLLAKQAGGKFKVGESVVVAEDNKQTYRADVKVVTITGIKRTPKMVKYSLSDGTKVGSERKMYLIEEK